MSNSFENWQNGELPPTSISGGNSTSSFEFWQNGETLPVFVVGLAEDADPSDLTAVPISGTSVILSWQDNSETNEGFSIERSLTGVGSWSEIGTVGDVTVYTDTGLTSGTTYYYRVRAFTGVEYSGYSNIADVTPDVPWAPENLTATAFDDDRIDLEWDDVSTEDGFKVDRSPDGIGSWAEIADLAANTTTYSDTGLTELTRYYYRVYAYRTGFDSPYSNIADAATLVAAPTDLVAEDTSPTEITLTWTNNSAVDTEIRIERSLTGVGSWSVIDTIDDALTTYIDTGLTTGVEYFYRIRACKV